MAAEAAPAPAPGHRVLPWRILLAILGAWALLIAPIVIYFGPAFGGVTLVVGLIPAFGGHVLGQRRMAHLAAGALLAAMATLALAPCALTIWGCTLVLIGCAAWEAWRPGGRAFVLALYGWSALVLAPTMPSPVDALPFVAMGLAWGALVTRIFQFTGKAAQPPLSGQTATSLGVFLLVGIFVAAQITAWIDEKYGYWVVLLFILRALSPPHQSHQSALTYALGAVLGSGCALLLTWFHPAASVTLPLTLMLVVLGLRYLPHPAPWSTAAFTSAVLLINSLGSDGILLRVEAVLLAVTIAMGLVSAISLGWRLVGRINPGLAPPGR
ncbi:MAG: FUSC family protein [Pseudomonadota bacterium]